MLRSAAWEKKLNQLIAESRHEKKVVQTAADSWKYYGLPKGDPGTLGLCRGNAG